MLDSFFVALYTITLAGLAAFGIYSLALAVLFLARRKQQVETPPLPTTWPAVTVQLPIYNEQYTIDRLIKAVCSFDYPPEALSIQVLDDSSDETREVVQNLVDSYKSQGVNIVCITRTDRTGYKAGALANGLKTAVGKYIVVFDADFSPHSDFLKCMIPSLEANEQVGMAQARWGHINADYNKITRGQALFLDGHFVVEQTARSRWGMLFNFNGSAGIWRRTCIEDVGGWQGDTLAEDLDLSYRAQTRGWKLAYMPDVVAPAEIPPQVIAFKRQQYRWACGAIQVLFKMGNHLWRAKMPGYKRFFGYVHLGAYLSHPLMLLLLLSCLPIVLLRIPLLPSLGWLSLAGFGPPLLFAISQWAVYPDWKRRILYFPVLMALGVGLAFNNTIAIMAALSRKPVKFYRTPKFRLENRQDSWSGSRYKLPIHWTVWVELFLAIYSAVLLFNAIRYTPALVPMLVIFTAGFGFISLMGLHEGFDPS